MVDRNEEQLAGLWKDFLRKKPDKDALISAIRKVPRCQMWGLEALMSKDIPGDSPTDIDLVLLMWDVDELHKPIFQELFRRNPIVNRLPVPRDKTIEPPEIPIPEKCIIKRMEKLVFHH